MTLSAGTRLGPYEVLAKLGEGGMGEVYRARDTQLKRDVALKVLPADVAADPERLARFRREAELLAALNHPHICTLYGLGEAAGVSFLVMEFVEGEDLSAVIARHAGSRDGWSPGASAPRVPLAEALAIATQLADALEYAHERGIIHRDLKPANIKLTPDGAVKVLDFGLAKALGPDGPGAAADAANSPTITGPAAMTKLGIILGTAAYMSPEQARGAAVDKRADIWAFGAILFEMLTGRPCFAGDTVTDVLAAVVKTEPDWAALPGETPSRVRDLLRRCLVKDRRHRLHDIGDARLEIQDALTAPAPPQPASVAAATRPLRMRLLTALPWAVAAASAAALIAVGIAGPKTASTPEPMHVSLALPPDAPFTGSAFEGLSISRDGRYVACTPGGRIYVRSLSGDGFRRIPGVENSFPPVFSADGSWVAFTDPKGLQKVPVGGGAPIPILEFAHSTSAAWDWTPGGEVLYSTGFGSDVMSVPASGGTPRRAAGPDRARGELLVVHAQRLTGSSDLLFTLCADSIASPDDCEIVLDDPAHAARRAVLVKGTAGRYLPTGHLMFGRGASILVAPLDLRARRLTGPSRPLVEGVAMNAISSWLQASVSDTGTLAYLPGSMQWAGPSTLVIVDRRGGERPLGRPQPFAIGEVSVSRDGGRVAVRLFKLNDDIHMYDMASGTFTRVTDEGGNEANPVWAPDGKTIVYRTSTGITRRLLDGAAKAETVGEEGVPSSISPDGRVLLYQRLDRETGQDIWKLRLEAGRKPEPLVRTRWNEQNAVFSPDGRWVAYQSDEGGTVQVYVGRFPDIASKHQVSVDGGTEPAWSPRGDELFFRDGERLMSAAVTSGDGLRTLAPAVVLQHAFTGIRYGGVQYAVLPDGQRFVIPRNAPVEPVREIRLVINWFEELKAKVPVK